MQPLTGLSFSEVDDQLVVRCSLATPRPLLDLEALKSLLRASGLERWTGSRSSLAELVARWNGPEQAFEVHWPHRADASFSIEVGKDAQQAWVDVRPAQGGDGLQPEEILQALAAAGVVHGIDWSAVQAACAQIQPARLVVATATAPVDGTDTRFELLVSDTRDRTPRVDAQGHIDFHQLGDIPVVKADQPLMRRHPGTRGTNGVDVRGAAMPAKAGKDIPFDKQLVGATLDKSDANLLRALFNGQPVHTDAGVTVEQVLRLKHVSQASGNIDFDGTVEIAEDIHPGMKVRATGDVVVKGTVEGAQVECEGNVQVAGGIIAHAVIRAGHTATARFAQSSTIHAQTTIAIADMAVHCTLEAHNAILVGQLEAHKGRLVGGVARAMMRVAAPTLGASAGGVTQVQVGVNPDLEHRQQELDALAEHQKADEEKLSKAVKHLTQHGDARHLLPQVQAAWKQVLAAWGQTLAEKAEVDAKLALVAGARVDVTHGVEGDVDLQFGKALTRVRQSFGPGHFSLDEDGKPIFTTEAGEVSRLA